MKSHELLEAVGGIDESFVQECLEEEKEKNLPEKKKNNWLKWGLAGVALLAVAAVVILIFRRKELTEEEILRLPVSPSEGCFVYDKVTEFWEPGEGDSFEEDIKARFPQILWDRALDMTVIDSLREKCIEQAWDYHEEMYSENVLYIPGPISDYVATEQKDLNKLADVVLIGTVKEEKGTYVGTNLLPITGVKVKAEKLFKGDAKGDADELNVEYYGGKVPFPEYAAGMTKEQIKKAFPDLEEEQYANTMVSLNDELSIHAHLEKERTYLFFLSYDEEKNTYFVLCGGYGAREYDGENVYDPDLKKYVPIKLQ